MGTYGTTHITKGKKKIDFTDSHDGYFSFMGRTNLLSIKHISDKTLDRLFKAYTAEVEDGDEVEITDRALQDIVFQVSKDNKKAEAVQWIQDALSDSIRASVTGFGPLLYLNKNPGFTDSETPNYIVDLDKKEFIYTNWSNHAVFKLSFDAIRNTPENVLNYLGNKLGSDFELIEGSIYSDLENEFDELAHKEELTDTELASVKELQQKMQREIEAVLNISPEIISEYEQKQEEERQQYLKEHAARYPAPIEDEEHGGFSIRSANGVTLPTLRKIIFFIQKTIEQNPDANYLLEASDWGMNEDSASGGFRLFSPKKAKYDSLHEKIVATIEYQFKVGMNGFSSSGTYGSDGLVKDEGFSMFGGDIPGPERSLYTLKEARALSPEWEDVVAQADPHLIYHVNYKEAREVALANEFGHPNFNIPWAYAALVNQDKELFEKVYPSVQNLPLSQADKDKVFPSLLQSFSDGQQINKIVGVEDNVEFTELVRSLGFFDDTKDKMTKSEQSKYFPAKPKKLKK